MAGRCWFAGLLLAALLPACGQDPAGEGGLDIGRLLRAGDGAGFARAEAVIPLNFPADHGPHPAFRNEWWYLTGNLRDAGGRRFGYQVTFFRTALRPPGPEAGGSAWRSPALWMAHAALTDVEGGRHLPLERFSRGQPGLAGAEAVPFRVWLDDWQLGGEGGGPGTHGFPWQLAIAAGAFDLALELDTAGPPVLQGERGLSRKSATPGNASYYYSFPRLATRGVVTLDGRRHAVSGLSWFDREWSTSALEAGQTGWDWFSLQLDDGGVLMYYQLRRGRDGVDPHSSGSWIGAGGRRRDLEPGGVRLRELAHWTSSGGVSYPVRWAMALGDDGPRWEIRAVLDAQFMDLAARYWEGAVDVLDSASGRRVGQGYLEMTRTRVPP